MAINLRSPHYILQGAGMGTLDSVQLKIYIWEGLESAVPSTPEYDIKKKSNGGADCVFEVSELIRDYLDIFFGGEYNSKSVWVKFELSGETTTGSSAFPDYSYNMLAFDGYSYFEEPNFDVDDNISMISNRTIFALADNIFRVPVNTKTSPTVTFLKDGKIVGIQNYSSSTDTSTQIAYASPLGEVNYDSYKERVLNFNFSYFEDSRCLQEFFDEFEIGEVDKVVVSNSSGDIETINVITLEECKYDPKKITFINKFGVFQDMYFFKKSVEKMSVKKDSYKSNTFNGSYYAVSDHVNKNFNVIGKESITLSSGYLSEEYNEVFKQLMLSEKVWITELTDTKELVLPINVTTSNITYKTSLNNKLVEYTIEFDKSFDTINNIR